MTDDDPTTPARRPTRAALLRDWLGEPTTTTRATTMLAWLVVVATCFGALFGTREALRRVDNESRARADAACTGQVRGREQIRGAFLDLYGLLDELGAGDDDDELEAFTAEARARLDERYPSIDLADCLQLPQASEEP